SRTDLRSGRTRTSRRQSTPSGAERIGEARAIHPDGVTIDHLATTYRRGVAETQTNRSAPELRLSYEIRVRGHLSPAFAAALGDPGAQAAPAQTILRRNVESSADLHEILRR